MLPSLVKFSVCWSKHMRCGAKWLNLFVVLSQTDSQTKRTAIEKKKKSKKWNEKRKKKGNFESVSWSCVVCLLLSFCWRDACVCVRARVSVGQPNKFFVAFFCSRLLLGLGWTLFMWLSLFLFRFLVLCVHFHIALRCTVVVFFYILLLSFVWLSFAIFVDVDIVACTRNPHFQCTTFTPKTRFCLRFFFARSFVRIVAAYIIITVRACVHGILHSLVCVCLWVCIVGLAETCAVFFFSLSLLSSSP